MGELSIDCEVWENGSSYYDAQNVLGLFSGPPEEASEEIVEMMDTTLAERVPGAGRRKGTYPGRVSDTIGFTILVSNIGRGAAMDRVEKFFLDATQDAGRGPAQTGGQGKTVGSHSPHRIPDSLTCKSYGRFGAQHRRRDISEQEVHHGGARERLRHRKSSSRIVILLGLFVLVVGLGLAITYFTQGFGSLSAETNEPVPAVTEAGALGGAGGCL